MSTNCQQQLPTHQPDINTAPGESLRNLFFKEKVTKFSFQTSRLLFLAKVRMESLYKQKSVTTKTGLAEVCEPAKTSRRVGRNQCANSRTQT